MYPELEQFQRIEEEYNSEIERLQERKKQLQEEKAEASRQYNKALSKVVYDRDSDSALELAERKKESTEISAELKKVKEKIEHLTSSKKDRLENMLPSLKEGRDREFQAARNHMRKKKDDLLRYRADYLMLIQQMYDVRKYAQDVDTIFKKTAKRFTHEYEYMTEPLPDVNLHNPFGEEEAYGIIEREVQQVYKTGKLPEWVRNYSHD